VRIFDFWRADKLRAASALIIGRILLGKGCVIARQPASSRTEDCEERATDRPVTVPVAGSRVPDATQCLLRCSKEPGPTPDQARGRLSLETH
jgi:hypothetical protein